MEKGDEMGAGQIIENIFATVVGVAVGLAILAGFALAIADLVYQTAPLL